VRRYTMVLTATNVDDCCLLGFDMHSDGTGNHHLTAQFTNSAGDQDGSSKVGRCRLHPVEARVESAGFGA
jgi:hypothetical protein